MAFDENGQAATEEDKVRICKRSYDTLVLKEYGVEFPPEDIIFDPLVFPCGTGDKNYFGSGKETIEGVRLVIDSGLAKKAGFDPRRGINTLLTEKISRASAAQRAGRAGHRSRAARRRRGSLHRAGGRLRLL